jgi:threonine/homoserine/homoserine lactone efflux protein
VPSLLFVSAAAALAATPGAGTLYVLARTLRGGLREGLATVAGTASGGAVHAIVAAVGGTALLGADGGRLRLVSIVGGLFLAGLGLRGLLTRPRDGAIAGETGAADPAARAAARRGAFRDGLIVALLNPTTALFLLAFLPPFVDPARPALPQLLALGAVVVALNASAHLAWMAATVRVGRVLASRPRLRLAVQRAGAVLLLLLAAHACTRVPRDPTGAPLADAARLRELHEKVMRAHRTSDVELLMEDEAVDSVVGNRGAVTHPTRDERRARFGPYLESTAFDVYRDRITPEVRVSADGTLGWVIVQVEARGVQTTPAGAKEPLAFVSAWIELYEKRDGRWWRSGNVSSFAP